LGGILLRDDGKLALAREVVDVLLVAVGQDHELLADGAGESVDATHGDLTVEVSAMISIRDDIRVTLLGKDCEQEDQKAEHT
jgi:hypothetical protein